MNELLNSIEVIEEACVLANLDTQYAMASLSEKNDMILESYDGDVERIKTAFGDDIVQEAEVLYDPELINALMKGMLKGAVEGVLTGAVEMIAYQLIKNAYVDSGIKKFAEQIKNVADIVNDTNGETDEKQAIEKFRKLKKAINVVRKNATRICKNARHQHKRFYIRELNEFAKLANICGEIIDEKKIMKKRAKKYDDTSVLKQQLKEFFEQSKVVLGIIAKSAGLKVQGDKVVEDPNANTNAPAESEAPKSEAPEAAGKSEGDGESKTTQESALADLDCEI